MYIFGHMCVCTRAMSSRVTHTIAAFTFIYIYWTLNLKWMDHRQRIVHHFASFINFQLYHCCPFLVCLFYFEFLSLFSLLSKWTSIIFSEQPMITQWSLKHTIHRLSQQIWLNSRPLFLHFGYKIIISIC